ncbi:MAG: hypothetical protein WCA48_20535, partial [Pseudomonas gingeri]
QHFNATKTKPQLRKQLGFCFCGVEMLGAWLGGLFAAVRRSDKPCSYSVVSYTRSVNDDVL